LTWYVSWFLLQRLSVVHTFKLVFMFLFFFFIFGLAFTHHTHSMSWVKLFTFIFHRPTLFISHWFSCILLDILSCYLTDFSVFHRWVFDSIIEELLCMPTISFGGVMFWTATCCVRTDWVCRSPRVTLSGRFTLAYGHASFILALFFSFFSEALFFFSTFVALFVLCWWFLLSLL
jgi:hypothetical protein